MVNTANIIPMQEGSPQGASPFGILSITANSDGSVTVNFTGVAGFSYRLQMTTDLASAVWTDVATNIFDDSGLSTYTDTNTTSQAQKFYRAVYP
jgi:hypothetical protein